MRGTMVVARCSSQLENCSCETVSEKLIKYQGWNLLNTITEWLSLTLCYEDMKIEIKEELGQSLSVCLLVFTTRGIIIFNSIKAFHFL